MVSETVLRYSDGQSELNGLIARDPTVTGRRPGVVVFHEAPGLADHIRRRIRMLAELGYVAVAADLFGDGKIMTGDDALGRLMDFQARPDLAARRVGAAFAALLAQDDVDPARTAAIGYCMGGTCALQLARDGVPVAAVVSFHGILTTATPAEKGVVRAKILVCTGSDDPLVPPEQVDAFEREMRAAKTDWQVVIYGNSGHAFTNSEVKPGMRPGFAYNADSDRRSWAAMRNLFLEVF